MLLWLVSTLFAVVCLDVVVVEVVLNLGSVGTIIVVFTILVIDQINPIVQLMAEIITLFIEEEGEEFILVVIQILLLILHPQMQSVTSVVNMVIMQTRAPTKEIKVEIK